MMLDIKAHDMALHGGFVAQEEHLRNSLKKLELELESLRPSFPERAARISGIVKRSFVKNFSDRGFFDQTARRKIS